MKAARTEKKTDRAWPLPLRAPLMRMEWHDLLFMHWQIDINALRPLIPKPLRVDTFHGNAWIGLVPFRMTGVAPTRSPNIPIMSRFPELNVRTYVTVDDKPGVWFFSLEATNWLANRFARRFFHLSYMDATIKFENPGAPVGKWIRFHSRRRQRRAPSAHFQVEYRPIGTAFRTEAGSLEEFLTARYCLYAVNQKNEVLRGEIDHDPWELKEAQAIIRANSMTDGLGIQLPETPPLLHYSKRTRAVAWSPKKI